MGKIHFNSLPSCPRPHSHLDPSRIWSPIPLPRAKPSCEKILLCFMQDLGQEAMLSLQRVGTGSRACSHPVWSCQEALGGSLMWPPHLSPPSPPDPPGSQVLPEQGPEQGHTRLRVVPALGAAAGQREGITWAGGKAPGFGMWRKQGQKKRKVDEDTQGSSWERPEMQTKG